MALVDRFELKRYICVTRTLFFAYILPWKTHYRNVVSELLHTVQLGFKLGDRVSIAGTLTLHSYVITLIERRLDQVQETLEKNIELQQKIGEDYPATHIPIWTQFVANLRGLAANPLELEGHFFSQTRDLPETLALGLTTPTYWVHILKTILHYHLGHYSSAYTNSLEVEPFLPLLTSHVVQSLFPLYQSLTILQLLDSQDQSVELKEKFERNLAKIRLWAEHAPMNFQHKLELLLAERARIDGDVGVAIDYYEAAIAGARENEYIREEALANELYGRFWLQRGNSSIARIYIKEAYALYRDWGANSIVQHLEAQFPDWLRIEPIDTGPLSPSYKTTEVYFDLDVNSLLKASQSIVREIELDRLLQNMIQIVMENAGAQRAFLIVEEDGEWMIAVQPDGSNYDKREKHWLRLEDCGLLAERIVNYVANSQETLVLDDASKSGDFVQDPYVQSNQARSVLCVPLINQGRTSAILYLENNLTRDAFTPERVGLLQLLSSQMAISIDNARTHDRLEQLLEERSRALDAAHTQIRSLFDNSPLGHRFDYS